MDNVILIAFQLPGRHFLRESNKMLFKIHLSRSADRKMNKKKTKQKKLQALNGRNYNGKAGRGGGVEGFWLFSTRFIRSFEGK